MTHPKNDPRLAAPLSVSQHREQPHAIPKPDAALWANFRTGSRAALIQIYNGYFDELYSYARQFTGDTELIKDAIQDVFVRLSEKHQQLGPTDSIKFYLYKAIKREVIYTLQQRRRKLDKLEGLKGQDFEYELCIEEQIIEKQIEDETLRQIRDAANRLSPRQREIVFYHFYEGFSIQQIKELMNFSSVQAAHNLLHRALDELRDVLALFPFLISGIFVC
jgi:RNA polymerase sigma factor (sigma-70 family)